MSCNVFERSALKLRDKVEDQIERQRQWLSKTDPDAERTGLIQRSIAMCSELLDVIRKHQGERPLPSAERDSGAKNDKA